MGESFGVVAGLDPAISLQTHLPQRIKSAGSSPVMTGPDALFALTLGNEALISAQL
jgi:hypothetical protein